MHGADGIARAIALERESGILPEASDCRGCDYQAMYRTKVYRRTATGGTETLKIVAYIDRTGGDDEIRVIHTVESDVVDDGIGFHGRGGEQWLRDRHAGWTADGFELLSSGPDY